MKNRIAKILENQKKWPGMYEGIFLEQGIVNYKDLGLGTGYLPKPTIDQMLNSFVGKPVIIYHKDVNPENCKEHAVGWVTNCYFDAAMGKYKAQFLITDEEAHEKIKNGYELSCAYNITNTGPKGTWHSLNYDFEIAGGSFTHLALVPNPRYEDSTIDPLVMQNSFPMIINSKGEATLIGEIPNKEEIRMKFKWFGKKEEKARSLENTFIDIDGKKVSVKELANAYKTSLENAHEEEGELGEDSEIEIQNSKGENVKVNVADMVKAFKALNGGKEAKNCSCEVKNGKGSMHAKNCAMYNAADDKDDDDSDDDKKKKKDDEDKDKDKKAENARIEERAQEIANAAIKQLEKEGALKKGEGLKFYKAVSNARHTEVSNANANEGSNFSNSREDQLARGNEMFGPVKKAA